MNSNKRGKEKNIEDVLSSIDSLLDTATDIELPDSNDSKDSSDSSVTPKTKTAKRTTKPQPSSRAKAKSRSVSQQKKPVRIRKPPAAGHRSPAAKITKPDDAAKRPAVSDDSPTRAATRLDPANHEQARSSTPVQKKSTHVEDPSKMGGKVYPDAASQDRTGQQDAENSLVFTTVDDDMSHVMRELPVLDDIVTAEDLALIGSGKEPPKKVLTEAFKRQSLSDKLIQILENQLSDYDISKLEYQYLHDLFDELLEEEKNRQ